MRLNSPSPLEVIMNEQGFYPPSILGEVIEEKKKAQEVEYLGSIVKINNRF